MPSSFKDAIAAASGHYPGNQWKYLSNAEQTRAIYREMQRIDLEQARTKHAGMSEERKVSDVSRHSPV